jgi:hypothetical protein
MSIWDQAPKNTRAVFDHLKLLAKRMRVETYGEIATAIEKAAGHEIAPLSLRYPLGFIRDNICRPRGLPLLNVLAVNGEDWRCGHSFLPDGVAFGDDEPTLWRGAVLAVFGYPWDRADVE